MPSPLKLPKEENGNSKEFYYVYGLVESFQKSVDREFSQIHESLKHIANKMEELPALHGRISMLDRELKESKVILSDEEKEAIIFAKKVNNVVDKMLIPIVVGVVILGILAYSMIETFIKWKPILEKTITK